MCFPEVGIVLAKELENILYPYSLNMRDREEML